MCMVQCLKLQFLSDVREISGEFEGVENMGTDRSQIFCNVLLWHQALGILGMLPYVNLTTVS